MADFVATPQQVVALTVQEAQRRGIPWFNAIHAGGMAGSFMQETGDFRADVINFQRRGDDGTAHGLMQWRGERYQNLLAFAQQNQMNPANIQTQIMFAFEEGDQNSPFADYGSVRAFREMSQATSAQDAAIAFIHAERPAGYDGNTRNAHDAGARVNHALRALGEGNADISQFGVAGTTGQTGTGITEAAKTRSQQMVEGLQQNGLLRQQDIDFGVTPQTNLTAREAPARPQARPNTPDFGISSFTDGGNDSFGGFDFNVGFTTPQSPFSNNTSNNNLTFGSDFGSVNDSGFSAPDFGLGR